MQLEYLISGGAPTIKKYKMAAGHAAGIVVLVPASNATGLTTSTTTGMIDAVGVTMDAILSAGSPVAYSTTQGDIEHLQSVIINSDAVFRALMVGSAANAAVEQRTVGTASSNGLTAVGTTGETDPSSPTMDEGTVWYNSGSNGGASRKITGVTTTLTTTVVVPFAANRVGDKFMTIGYTPGTIGVTTSTDLKNIRVDLAATGAEMYCVDLILNGPNDSALEVILRDHIFSGSSLA